MEVTTYFSLISQNPYFKKLSHQQQQWLVDKSESITIQKDHYVFHEGDIADYFYLIVNGDIHIISPNSAGKNVVLARLQAGDFFGEQAFYHTRLAKRRATAKALKDSVLLRLHYSIIENIKKQHTSLPLLLDKKNNQYIFEKLNKLTEEINTVPFDFKDFSGETKSFSPREVIFFQEEKPDYAYLILSGTVDIRFYSDEKKLLSVCRIGNGQLFGEASILQNSSRAGMAVAVDSVEVLVISLNKIKLLYEFNKDFKQYCETLSSIYQLPKLGTVIQYTGKIFDTPSVCSLLHLNEENDFICEQALNGSIFSISSTHSPPGKIYKYENQTSGFRIIHVYNDHLVSVINKGTFEDNAEIVKLVISQTKMDDNLINEFQSTGSLFSLYKKNFLETANEICTCLHISYKTISDLISQGKTTYESICAQTGAGTVCGSCKPLIYEMLGFQVWIPCKIINVINHNPMVHSYQLKPVDEKIKKFISGQHAVIKATINDVNIRRSYTLTSTNKNNYYEFTIRHEKNGIFSNWLFEHADKDSIIFMSEPVGNYNVELSSGLPMIFFVAGIGVTPAIATMRALSQGIINNPLYIDYSVRTTDQCIVTSELTETKNNHKNFNFHIRETSTHGHITESDIANVLNSYPNAHIYICGPQSYNNYLVDTLLKLHVNKNNIHTEEFINASASN